MLNTNIYQWSFFELTKDNIVLEDFDCHVNIISTPKARLIVKMLLQNGQNMLKIGNCYILKN